MASKTWYTASPAAGGVCMTRLAMRPAKSSSNQPTDWRKTWPWARQRISVPKFGMMALLSRSAWSPKAMGRTKSTNRATRRSSVPWSWTAVAGSAVVRVSTRDPE